MSVIVELQVGADAFELGRILELVPGEHIETESVVPMVDRAMPLFWVYDIDTASFEADISGHPSVDNVMCVDEFEDRALYAMRWDTSADVFLTAVVDARGSILDAAGRADGWYFELRFPSHDDLKDLQQALSEADIGFEVLRLYNPTKPEAGPWYGLTPTQREALVLAVETGYYDIPRGITTVDLADRLDISDQAVTERLRRAIVNLVSNSLLVDESNQE